jgi:hypothetical protein
VFHLAYVPPYAVEKAWVQANLGVVVKAYHDDITHVAP